MISGVGRGLLGLGDVIGVLWGLLRVDETRWRGRGPAGLFILDAQGMLEMRVWLWNRISQRTGRGLRRTGTRLDFRRREYCSRLPSDLSLVVRLRQRPGTFPTGLKVSRSSYSLSFYRLRCNAYNRLSELSRKSASANHVRLGQAMSERPELERSKRKICTIYVSMMASSVYHSSG